MKKSIIKRISDALEKLAVGAALVGLFQVQESDAIKAFSIGGICFLLSLILTALEKKS